MSPCLCVIVFLVTADGGSIGLVMPALPLMDPGLIQNRFTSHSGMFGT